MSITPPPNFRQRLDADMLAFVQRQERVIERRLMYIGEMAVNTARTSRRYLDQTGNLTSSIGYVIVKRGSILNKSGFEQVKDGKEGVLAGEALATTLAGKFPYDYALIVVAGMDYAAYVEAMGLGGMTAAELQAKVDIESFISKFK